MQYLYFLKFNEQTLALLCLVAPPSVPGIFKVELLPRRLRFPGLGRSKLFWVPTNSRNLCHFWMWVFWFFITSSQWSFPVPRANIVPPKTVKPNALSGKIGGKVDRYLFLANYVCSFELDVINIIFFKNSILTSFVKNYPIITLSILIEYTFKKMCSFIYILDKMNVLKSLKYKNIPFMTSINYLYHW